MTAMNSSAPRPIPRLQLAHFAAPTLPSLPSISSLLLFPLVVPFRSSTRPDVLGHWEHDLRLQTNDGSRYTETTSAKKAPNVSASVFSQGKIDSRLLCPIGRRVSQLDCRLGLSFGKASIAKWCRNRPVVHANDPFLDLGLSCKILDRAMKSWLQS